MSKCCQPSAERNRLQICHVLSFQFQAGTVWVLRHAAVVDQSHWARPLRCPSYSEEKQTGQLVNRPPYRAILLHMMSRSEDRNHVSSFLVFAKSACQSASQHLPTLFQHVLFVGLPFLWALFLFVKKKRISISWGPTCAFLRMNIRVSSGFPS